MEIKVGDNIPEIVLKNQKGDVFDLKRETEGKNQNQETTLLTENSYRKEGDGSNGRDEEEKEFR